MRLPRHGPIMETEDDFLRNTPDFKPVPVFDKMSALFSPAGSKSSYIELKQGFGDHFPHVCNQDG